MNAQQFPRKASDPLLFQFHHEVKRLFDSRFGNMGAILQFDYSQLELRIAGMFSKDENLLKAYLSGDDVHKATAAMINKIDISQVTDDLRSNAKAVNFGIIYGKSGHTFARDLYGYDPTKGRNSKVNKKAIQKGYKLVDDYLETFRGLRDWIEETKEYAHSTGYVETLFGFRRRLPNLKSRESYIREEAERMAVNTPIQGTGACMTILSVIEITNWLLKNNMKSKLIGTVHDSIVFDVFIPEIPEVFNYVKQTMEHIHEPYIDTLVPVVADGELGVNYGEIVGLDNPDGLNTERAFREWVEEQNHKKHKKEIEYLMGKHGYSEKQVNMYLRNWYGNTI